MPAVYYESYQPNYAMGQNNNHGAAPPPPQHHKEEDTQQAASLLLLLGRSVTPDPQIDDSDHSSRSRTTHLTYSSPFGGTAYSYESAYSDRSPVPSMPTSSSSSPYPRKDKTQQGDTNNSKGLLPPTSAPSSTLLDADIDYESLIEGSKLVLMKDRDLVPDCLFVAMAQMKPCRLTHADRVGCYKARDVGFLGMCCKHCGGQPGFGRYYPNSVRSLAQTTTSQTILKHIGNKCRFCPPHIRSVVLQLQQQSNLCEGTSSGRPRYGSRKVFFQRVWQRLHADGEDEPSVDEEDDSACSSTESTPAFVDESTSSVSSTEEETAKMKRKNRFGTLPLQKNKRAKTAAPPQMPV